MVIVFAFIIIHFTNYFLFAPPPLKPIGGTMHVTKYFFVSIIFTAGVLASSLVIAAPDAAAFQASKDQQIASLQERLQMIQSHLSCVQAAQDPAGIKSCQEAAKQKSNALEEKLKAQRAEKKAQHNKTTTNP